MNLKKMSSLTIPHKSLVILSYLLLIKLCPNTVLVNDKKKRSTLNKQSRTETEAKA